MEVSFLSASVDLGRTDLVKHHIRLRDNTTFKERHRRIPPTMVEDIRQHLQEMLDLGVILRSENPFASNVVLFRKKDQSLGFCIDLRKLNNRTIKDFYYLPRNEETLDTLHGAKWFSTLDMKSAYCQVEIAEEDKHKAAFTGFFLNVIVCRSN